MIRYVALITLKEGVTPEQIDAWLSALRAMALPGTRSVELHEDLGLRPGNAQHAVVADFDDEAAYRRFDTDPEHDRIRREIVGPLIERIERCQFAL